MRSSGGQVSKGEATREAIIRMALAQAMEVGLDSISLGVLAHSLELSKSGLFAHFKSKEVLQLAVLEEAIEIFADRVVTPALGKPRGEPRVRALFEGKLQWIDSNGFGTGCFFAALSQEFDDRPGLIRDRLIQSQNDWRNTLVKAVSLAVREHHFDQGLDPEQFVFELMGIDAAFQQSHKLFGDASARDRAGRAYERLAEDAQRKHRR